MSWHKDPELFMGFLNGWGIVTIVKKYGVPLRRGDINFSKPEGFFFRDHLYLGNNKESDFDDLKYSLTSGIGEYEYIVKFVNYQGSVVLWNFVEATGTWTREKEITSIISGLPSIPQPETILAGKYFLERKYAMIEEKCSKLKDEATCLNEQMNGDKNDMEALEQEILDLTVKLKECRGGGDGDVEPWMSKAPCNWVPFGELDVKDYPRGTPLMITDTPKFGEDRTTNVQASRFCQGIFPMVVVNVSELIPNEGKARFDPNIWCSLSNAGNCYAARKPTESEMSFYPHMRL